MTDDELTRIEALLASSGSAIAELMGEIVTPEQRAEAERAKHLERTRSVRSRVDTQLQRLIILAGRMDGLSDDEITTRRMRALGKVPTESGYWMDPSPLGTLAGQRAFEEAHANLPLGSGSAKTSASPPAQSRDTNQSCLQTDWAALLRSQSTNLGGALGLSQAMGAPPPAAPRKPE